MKCPNCQTEVSPEHMNIQTDLAKCQACHHIFKISENLEDTATDGFDIENPPKGAWLNSERHQLVIGATTRSPLAFFLVPFMLVWSGGSLGGIYGSQIIKGEFSLFMSLFGIPFLIGSIFFWGIALMAIWGKVEVFLTQEGGKIRTGIGAMGFSKSFRWDEISSIEERAPDYKYGKKQKGGIVLEGKRRISFGTGLNSSRRYYMYRTLKIIMSKVKNRKSIL